MKILGPIVVMAFPLFASCGVDSSEGGWTELRREALNETQDVQLEKAVAARDAMFGKLMTRVSTEMEKSGPAGAVHVCREAAPEIANSVAEEHGVQIGRTSSRLRNPNNRAPAWAEALLADQPEQECLTAGPEDQLGVALPIHLMAGCLACHGAPEKIASDVKKALAEAYPADQATGYTAGELRGWFWIEVPAEGS